MKIDTILADNRTEQFEHDHYAYVQAVNLAEGGETVAEREKARLFATHYRETHRYANGWARHFLAIKHIERKTGVQLHRWVLYPGNDNQGIALFVVPGRICGLFSVTLKVLTDEKWHVVAVHDQLDLESLVH